MHKDPDHDRRIDDELIHRHYFVLRFRYKPPMSDKRREEILHVLCLIVEWRLSLKSEEQRGGRIAQYGLDYEYEKVEAETEAEIKKILGGD